MQESFQYGYESVYGKDKSQVLLEKDIDKSLNNPQCHSYEMIDDNNEIIGGAIVGINENNINHLDFLFVRVGVQSKGIGQAIWKKIEKLYPETEVWKTCAPYFDKRNIHFNEKHPDPNMSEDIYEEDDGMFEFEKEMNKQ